MYFDTSYGPADANQEEGVLGINIPSWSPGFQVPRVPADLPYTLGDYLISQYNPAINAYHPAAIAYRTAVPHTAFGQTPGIEVGLRTLDGSNNLFPALLNSDSHTPVAQAFHWGCQTYGYTVVSTHQAASDPSIALPGGNKHSSGIHQAHSDLTVGEFRKEVPQLLAKTNGRLGIHDGEEQWYLRPDIEGLRDHFGHTQGTLISSHRINEGRCADGSLSYRAGAERNQVVKPVPAELPPAEVSNAGAQDHGGGEPREGHARNVPQSLPIRKHIPADPYARLPTHPSLRAVQQTMYRCESAQRWKPLSPIDFIVQGCEGINLADAMNMKFSKLDGREDLMFMDEGTGSSVSLRIDFVGHQRESGKARQVRSIPTKNYKKERNRITRQKLGHDVAKLIGKHLEKSTFGITFEQMYLVKLHNVSRASWQPEVWYKASTRS